MVCCCKPLRVSAVVRRTTVYAPPCTVLVLSLAFSSIKHMHYIVLVYLIPIPVYLVCFRSTKYDTHVGTCGACQLARASRSTCF